MLLYVNGLVKIVGKGLEEPLKKKKKPYKKRKNNLMMRKWYGERIHRSSRKIQSISSFQHLSYGFQHSAML